MLVTKRLVGLERPWLEK